MGWLDGFRASNRQNRRRSLSARAQTARHSIGEMRAPREARQAKQIEDVRGAFPIHPVWMAHCLNEVEDKNAIVVNELGMPQPFLKYEAPNSSFGNSAAGRLGRGLAGALGAKLAAPHAQRRITSLLADVEWTLIAVAGSEGLCERTGKSSLERYQVTAGR
jgi:thiamine pyrophosphate-dependent acetolactate synthase large subunit-like protein